MKVLLEISSEGLINIKPIPPIKTVKEGEKYILRNGNLDLLQIEIGPWQDISRPREIHFLEGFQKAFWAGAEIVCNLVPFEAAS